jgi:hypothetical protein
MYFGPVYNLTNEQRAECKVKQKEYAKKVTKMIKNREYTVGNDTMRITFRIVSVLASKFKYDINDYRLNVEITKVSCYYGGTWSNRTPYKDERVRKYTMTKYKDWIQGELGGFLNIFGFGSHYSSNSAAIYLETPKIINRR